MITVFTPTYNRAKLLLRLFSSLCQQTYSNFEWVIVDDGSTDDTKTVVDRLVNELNQKNLFTIRYYYKKNGGKHTAINVGVSLAKGDLFLILDSDDSLPSNSLQIIEKEYKAVQKNNSFCGVCGYMAHHDGTVIGTKVDKYPLDTNSLDMRYVYHIAGDMCEVFKTEVLKEYPFLEVPSEKFCPEDLVLNRMATKYKLRLFEQVIYYRDYLEGGLTNKIVKIRMESPIASITHYSELLSYKIPFIQKTKAAVNFWRFNFCLNKKSNITIGKRWLWTIPFGYMMHVRDLKSTKARY
jgi:glycosyltransferase involved in cell wall biosynthesis